MSDLIYCPSPLPHGGRGGQHEPKRSASCTVRSAALVPVLREMSVQVDFLLSRLKVLYERIDDTEDLINIELDHRYLPCT